MAVLPFDSMASFNPPRRFSTQRFFGFCKGVEVEIFLEQGRRDALARLDPGRAQRKFERGLREKGEIAVVLERCLQPGIFKLLEPPDLRDQIAFARTKLLGLGPHRVDVVQRSISVEDQALDQHNRSSPCRPGRQRQLDAQPTIDFALAAPIFRSIRCRFYGRF
jgi:hypothetical protein